MPVNAIGQPISQVIYNQDYDQAITLRAGAMVPIYATATTPAGVTGTIQSGATVTVYGPNGAVVAGFNAVAISGHDGVQQNPRVWYILNTKALPGPGDYVVLFDLQALGSDGITYGPDQTVHVEVTPAVRVVATYDQTQLLTNPLFQTRLAAADTNVNDPDFSDSELLYFLAQRSNKPDMAAALALRSAAADTARTATITKKGTRGNDQSAVYKALLEMADALEGHSFTLPAVDPDVKTVFTDCDGDYSRSMRHW